jgi:N-acetylglucosaminylphosphatidylinositol deacetylase
MQMGLERRGRRNWQRVDSFSDCDKKTMYSSWKARMFSSFYMESVRQALMLRSEFPDSMTTTWDKQTISNLLSSAFAPNLSNPMKNKSADAPTATIDVLITFDRSGVSSHPNHISLYHGARHFIASLIHNRHGWACPVDLYTLTSVSLLRKYTSFVDSIVSLLVLAFRFKQMGDHPSPLLFLSGPEEMRTAQKAMTAWLLMI